MTVQPPSLAAIAFREPDRAFGGLAADTAAGLVSAASDLALILDREGVIRDVSVSSGDLAEHGIGDWLDRRWIDTVTDDSKAKVAEMLDAAFKGHAARWRQVNHPADDGADIPVRYFALSAGLDGRVIVIGRDLQASAILQQRLLAVQQSVERDYLRLRQAEQRYRLLFQSASEAVLILDGTSRRIREANPAVQKVTGRDPVAVIGQPFNTLLDSSSFAEAEELLSSANSSAGGASTTVRLAGGAACLLSASLYRHDRMASLLVRLTPESLAPVADPNAALTAVLSRISDAFVVTDTDLRILTANPAFLDLVHLASREEVVHLPLDRYLGRPQIDLKVMLAQLKEHGSLRNFATVIRSGFGEPEDVEVTAVVVPDDSRPTYGFSIRNVSRRLPSGDGVSTALPLGATARSVEQLTQLIGRVPMKDIVRESTDLIEKMCIEAALNLTQDNRASAADVLGLSRQSLYSKLRRYGLGDLDD